jgi:hypothetical protein
MLADITLQAGGTRGLGNLPELEHPFWLRDGDNSFIWAMGDFFPLS